ncbi:hypothetical protein [Sphingobium sp. D43FB]|uniref:hypothetical protein n=1 Tax=Sphingobium sp. D43FB TaxID=2017595 RepID=UPI0008559C2E|nr:hypothetical protein [Sphingobium sp. D43FB]AOF97189.1 hypothetical protein BSY17_920 [Sphingobium sp. RAC03]
MLENQGMEQLILPNPLLVDRSERRLLIGRSKARTDEAKSGAEGGRAAEKQQ